jgi:hypothetical protein
VKEHDVETTDEGPVAEASNPDEDRLKADLDRAWAAVERVRARNAEKSPDEILEAVTEEVEAVRQERYERRAANRKNGRRS